MTYELLLVPQAEADVDSIIRYLSLRSPQGAIAWCERWEQVLAGIGERPAQLRSGTGVGRKPVGNSPDFVQDSSRPNVSGTLYYCWPRRLHPSCTRAGAKTPRRATDRAALERRRMAPTSSTLR
jgi:hypothetical protein